MAELNYRNPGALDPYGEWKPQGFLAGWQYADRMKDYQTMRDLSNQTTELANQKALSELQNYRADAPVRQLQRQNQMELLPWQGRTAVANEVGNAWGAEQTMGERAALHFYNTTNQLDAAKRERAVKDAIAFSSLVKGFAAPGQAIGPQEWSMILGQARRMGIDTKDFEGQDPDRVIQFYSLMDAEHLKYLRDSDMLQYKEGAATGRTEIEQENANYRARVAAAAQRDTAGSAARLKQINQQRAIEILTKYRSGTPLTHGEQAELDVFRMQTDPFYKYEAQSYGKTRAVEGAMGAIEGEPARPQLPAVPQTPSNEPKEMITIEGNQYEVIEKLPNGQIRIRDPRSGRTGVWGR